MSEIRENNRIYPNLSMELGRNFPGVDGDFWTMHKVILESSLYSFCIQGFQIKYKIIICIASYF